MPTESAFLLAGLLFIAAALGYVFARFGESDDQEISAAQLSADYLKGLNYVLNEEPDRAVELFMRMAELDDDALETHFALGSLFRKRGEVDRAIRVHQNLMARPSLSSEQKDQAKAELAEDYLGAGLFDRAEDLFEELCESPEFRLRALERLIRVFEVTREWERAIETQLELERTDPGMSGTSAMAHYYCELAEQALAGRDFTVARQMLKKAESGHKHTVRSTMARAGIAHDTGDPNEAIRLYRQAALNSPDLLVAIIPRLAASCRAAENDAELTAFLRKLLHDDPQKADAIAMATVIDLSIENPVALEALQQFIVADPTLSGLIEVDRLERAAESARSGILNRVRQALHRIIVTRPGFRCRQCGYACLILQWQCPGCRSWETVKPETRIKLAVAN